MSEFAKVHCKIPNGVILRVFKEYPGPFGTTSLLLYKQVTLRAGDNDVDSAFFAEWMAANSDNDLVKEKFIEERKI